MNDASSELRDLLRTKALGYGEITLASGKKSHYYVDGRLVTLSARGALAVGSSVFGVIRGQGIAAIGGPTMGADPIVASVSLVSAQQGEPIDAFIIRKEPKKHGRGRWMEGPPLQEGSRVVIVDDTATTGASLLASCKAAEEAGAVVAKVITLVDREEGARELLEGNGYAFEPLFTARDLGVDVT